MTNNSLVFLASLLIIASGTLASSEQATNAILSERIERMMAAKPTDVSTLSFVAVEHYTDDDHTTHARQLFSSSSSKSSSSATFSSNTPARRLSYRGVDTHGGHVSFDTTAIVGPNVVSLDQLHAKGSILSVDCSSTSHLLVAMVVSPTTQKTSSSSSSSSSSNVDSSTDNAAWGAASSWNENTIFVGSGRWGCEDEATGENEHAMPFYRKVETSISSSLDSSNGVKEEDQTQEGRNGIFLDVTPVSASAETGIKYIRIPTVNVPVTAAFSKLHLTLDRASGRGPATTTSTGTPPPTDSSSSHPHVTSSSTSTSTSTETGDDVHITGSKRALGATSWGAHPWSSEADSAAPNTMRMGDASPMVAGMTWNMVNNSASVLHVANLALMNPAGHTMNCVNCYAWGYVDFAVSLVADNAALESVNIRTSVYVSASLTIDAVLRDTGNGSYPMMTETLTNTYFNATANATQINSTVVNMPNPVPDTQFFVPLVRERTVAVLAFDILGVPFAIPVKARMDVGMFATFNSSASGTTPGNNTALITNTGIAVGGSAVFGASFTRNMGWRSVRERSWTLTPSSPSYDVPSSVSLRMVPYVGITSQLFGGLTVTSQAEAHMNLLARAGPNNDNSCSGPNNTRVYAEIRTGSSATVYLGTPTASLTYAPQCTMYGCSVQTTSSSLFVPLSGTIGSLSTLPRTLGPFILNPDTTNLMSASVGCVLNKNAIISEATLSLLTAYGRVWNDQVNTLLPWNTTLVCSVSGVCSYEVGPWDGVCTSDCGPKSTKSRFVNCRANLNGTSFLVPTEACMATGSTAGLMPSKSMDCSPTVPCGNLRIFANNNAICNTTLAFIQNSVFSIPLRPGCMAVPQLGVYFKDLTCATGGITIQGEACTDPFCESCVVATLPNLIPCRPWLGNLYVDGSCGSDSTESQYDEIVLMESGRSLSLRLGNPISTTVFWRYYAVLIPQGTDADTLAITIQYTINSQNFPTPEQTLQTIVYFSDTKCIDPLCGAAVLSRTDELIALVPNSVFPANPPDQLRMRTILVKANAQMYPPGGGGVKQYPRVYMSVYCASPLPGGCTMSVTSHIRNNPGQGLFAYFPMIQPNQAAYAFYRPSSDAHGFIAAFLSNKDGAGGVALLKAADTAALNGMVWPKSTRLSDAGLITATSIGGDVNMLIPSSAQMYNFTGQSVAVLGADGGFGSANGPRDYLVTIQTGGSKTSVPGGWITWLFDIFMLQPGAPPLTHTIATSARLAYLIPISGDASNVILSAQIKSGAITMCIGPGAGTLDVRICSNNTFTPSFCVLEIPASTPWWSTTLTAVVIADNEAEYTLHSLTYTAIDSVSRVQGAVSPGSAQAYMGPVSDILPKNPSRGAASAWDMSLSMGASWQVGVSSSDNSPAPISLFAASPAANDLLAPRGVPVKVSFPTTIADADAYAVDVAPGSSAAIEGMYSVPTHVQPLLIAVTSANHGVLASDAGVHQGGGVVDDQSNNMFRRLLRRLQQQQGGSGDPSYGTPPPSTLPGIKDGATGGYVDPRNDQPRLFVWDPNNLLWAEATVDIGYCNDPVTYAAIGDVINTVDYGFGAYRNRLLCAQFPISKFMKPSVVPTTSSSLPAVSSDVVIMLQMPGSWRARVAAVPTFYSGNDTQATTIPGFNSAFLACPEGALEAEVCVPVLARGVSADIKNCGAQMRGSRVVLRSVTPLPSGAMGALTVAILHSPATSYGCPGVGAKKTYVWDVGTWSACSSSCGFGFRSRTVTCKDANTGAIIADSTLCPGTAPLTSKVCSVGDCVVVPSPWSPCSAPCNGGIQYRSIRCLNGNGTGMQVDSDLCTGSVTQPSLPLTQSCSMAACVANTYYIIVGSWEDCSARCGGGVSQRSVTCMQFLNGALVQTDIPQCESKLGPRPISSRGCNARPCARAEFEVTFAEMHRLPYNIAGWFNASDNIPDYAFPATDLIPNNGVRLYELPIPSRVSVPQWPMPPPNTNLTAYFAVNPLPPYWPATHGGVCVEATVQSTIPYCSANDYAALASCTSDLLGCLGAVPSNFTDASSNSYVGKLLPLGLSMSRQPFADPASVCICYAKAQACVAARKCTARAAAVGDPGDVASALYTSCAASSCGVFYTKTDFAYANASCSAASGVRSVYSELSTVLDIFAMPGSLVGDGGRRILDRIQTTSRPLSSNGFLGEHGAVGRGILNAGRTSIGFLASEFPTYDSPTFVVGVRASGPGVNITLRTNYTLDGPIQISGDLGTGVMVRQTIPPFNFDPRQYLGKIFQFGTGRFMMVGTNSITATNLMNGGLNLTITLACDSFIDPNNPINLAYRSAMYLASPSDVFTPLVGLFAGFRATQIGGVGNGNPSTIAGGWELVAKPYILSQATNTTIISGIIISEDNRTLTLIMPTLPGYNPAADEILSYTIPGAFLSSGRDTPLGTAVRVNATSPFVRDCVVSGWSRWSGCQQGSTCNDGIQSRSRTVLQAARGTGLVCPPIVETRPCDACDPCSNTLCYNQGLCIEGTCVCPPGFTGVDCSIPPPFLTLCTVSASAWGSCGLANPYGGRAAGETMRSVFCGCSNISSYNFTSAAGASPDPTPSASQTPSSTPAPPSESSSPTPSPSGSISPSSSPFNCEVNNVTGISNCTSPSPNASSTPSNSPSMTASVSISASNTGSTSFSPSATPTISRSQSPSPSFNWTGNYSAMPNASWSPTPTASPTPVYAPPNNACGYASILPHSTSCPVSAPGGAWRNVTAVQLSIPLVGVNMSTLLAHGNIWDAYGLAFTRQLANAVAVPVRQIRPVSFGPCISPAYTTTPASTGCITIEVLEDPAFAPPASAGALTAVSIVYRIACAIGGFTDSSRTAGFVPKPVFSVPRSASTSLLYKPFVALAGGIASVSWRVVAAFDPFNPPVLVPLYFPWTQTPIYGTLLQMPGLGAVAPPASAANSGAGENPEIATLKGSTYAFVILFFITLAALGYIIRRRGFSSRAPRGPGSRRSLTKYETANPLNTNAPGTPSRSERITMNPANPAFGAVTFASLTSPSSSSSSSSSSGGVALTSPRVAFSPSPSKSGAAV